MSSKIPQWALNILYSKGFQFEVAGLNSEIWKKFISEFNDQHFAERDLPNYFPAFIEKLIDNGWIDKVRTQLKASKAPFNKVKKSSSIDILEEKIDNFFKEQSLKGEIVEFKVIVQCPHCNNNSSISRYDLMRGIVDCGSCNEFFSV